MQLIKVLSLLFLLCIGVATAQGVSVGVIGGVPLTTVVNEAATPDSLCFATCGDNGSRFTIGPSFRVNLPMNLRVEVDALYRPYGFTAFGGDGFNHRVSGSQWRLPVLLQYRFNARVLHPFVEGGLSFEHLANLSDTVPNLLPLSLQHRSDLGVVVGGGVDLSLRHMRISGELRYTRQTVTNFANVSNLNQAEILLGIRF